MTTKSNKSMKQKQSRDRILVKRKPKWSDLEAKKIIFEEIISKILADPDLGQEYVDNPRKARKEIGKRIEIPNEVKIVFLPAGDSEMAGGGSVVIELPPRRVKAMSFQDKMELFLCTYNPW